MKILKGMVVSTRMEKTAVVAVESWWTHPVYTKRTKRSRRFKAHDEVGVKNGDWVEIEETKPFSKEKRWKITKVLKNG
jgi:small subunit ribosomal protein S17